MKRDENRHKSRINRLRKNYVKRRNPNVESELE